MTEKLSPGERPEPKLVGSASEAIKKAIKESTAERFGKGHLQEVDPEFLAEIRANEREKSPAELRMIDVANEITNRFLSELGLQPFDVPTSNVHFISREFFEKHEVSKKTAGLFAPNRQGIFMDGEESGARPVEAASNILHEVFHAKEFLSIEVSEEQSALRRSGTSTHSGFKKYKRLGGEVKNFLGLVEAIAASLEQKYFREAVRSNEYLSRELEWLNSPEAESMRRTIASQEEITPEDIRVVNPDGHWTEFPYYHQRRVLCFMIDAATESGKFGTREEVFRKFLIGSFSGNILKLAGMVEYCFGEGSFRFLGTMDTDNMSALRVFDYLTKQKRLVEAGKKRRPRK